MVRDRKDKKRERERERERRDLFGCGRKIKGGRERERRLSAVGIISPGWCSYARQKGPSLVSVGAPPRLKPSANN
jgi:hypothetical protein